MQWTYGTRIGHGYNGVPIKYLQKICINYYRSNITSHIWQWFPLLLEIRKIDLTVTAVIFCSRVYLTLCTTIQNDGVLIKYEIRWKINLYLHIHSCTCTGLYQSVIKIVLMLHEFYIRNFIEITIMFHGYCVNVSRKYNAFPSILCKITRWIRVTFL